ncbi:MAG: hypothetical protein CMO74_12560 [Verrucomicrobiales bacterium]|nr:hypothetical protein [Verrucomicrobiales bacterium]|tara:strand:- start:1389 stop:1811 length:423 start_codon:yes stop_codon:yes gene_type:complete
MENETRVLQAGPIKEKTEALCDAIANQEEFKELYAKIEAFMNDEKLKYDFGQLNDQGALLEQKQQYGLEIKQEEYDQFEKLRESFMSQKVATDFLEAQEEVQDIQNRIHQYLAKMFEIGRTPSQDDFDFCSDGFGDCGCG